MSTYNYRGTSSQYQRTNTKPFNGSEKLALKYGFQPVYKEDAYNGRYFVKNGKKWIHKIESLKAQICRDEKLDYISDSDLEDMMYDVEIYYISH